VAGSAGCEAASIESEDGVEPQCFRQQHESGVGVVHRRVRVLLRELCGFPQFRGLCEVVHLKIAAADELGQMLRTSWGIAQQVHGLGNHRAARDEATVESVENVGYFAVMGIGRLEVGDDRSGIEQPVAHERQLRSRMRRCMSSFGSAMRKPTRSSPIRSANGLSVSALSRISRGPLRLQARLCNVRTLS
jgi:hypothetical protein